MTSLAGYEASDERLRNGQSLKTCPHVQLCQHHIPSRRRLPPRQARAVATHRAGAALLHTQLSPSGHCHPRDTPQGTLMLRPLTIMLSPFVPMHRAAVPRQCFQFQDMLATSHAWRSMLALCPCLLPQSDSQPSHLLSIPASHPDMQRSSMQRDCCGNLRRRLRS